MGTLSRGRPFQVNWPIEDAERCSRPASRVDNPHGNEIRTLLPATNKGKFVDKSLTEIFG